MKFGLSSCMKPFQQQEVSWHPCRVSGLPAVLYKSHCHGCSALQDDAGHHPVNLEKSRFARVRGSRRFGPFYFANNATQRMNNMTATLKCCTGLHKCKSTERQLVFSRVSWRETTQNSENMWRGGLENWKSFTTASDEKIKIIENVRQGHILGSLEERNKNHLSVH